MADPAKRLVFTDNPAREFPSIDALMAAMAETGRTGARAAAAAVDPGAWAALERQLEQGITERTRGRPASTIDADTFALIRRVRESLAVRPIGAERVQSYSQCVATIDDARTAGAQLITPDAMACHVHAAIVWYSAWHLAGAGFAMPAIAAVIGSAQTRSYERPAPLPPPAAPRPRPATVATPAPEAHPAPTSTAPTATAEGWIGRIAAMAEAARASAIAIGRETAKARKERLEQVEAARKAAAARLTSTPPSQERERPSGSGGSPSSVRVDGNRMRAPVLGTWLMLVLLSWVALVWGAILAIPFVGPFGLLGAMMGGFVSVPLWGTVFGFLGMGAARDSTLRQMGFTDVDPNSGLARTAARLAGRLDLPPPRIGTIPAFNAFAMGSDHRSATVAIGKPLMDTLSPDELAAVIGHELGHVVSGDMRKMMLMRTFQNACVWYMLAQGLKQFMRWVICWAAELAILAFSRRREYWADAVGAALTSKEAMIGALRKLEHAPAMTAGERTHARFMFRGSAFSTHPSVAERIAALENEGYIRRLPVKG
ncbi:MAG: M48 family metalloprotease [Hyphomicrobiaceae bacterium]